MFSACSCPIYVRCACSFGVRIEILFFVVCFFGRLCCVPTEFVVRVRFSLYGGYYFMRRSSHASFHNNNMVLERRGT